MLCYKNGALARERVRARYANDTNDNGTDAGTKWTRFNEIVRGTPAGNNGYLGFYFPQPEIIPPNITGEFFFKPDAGATSMAAVPEVAFPPFFHPRAILESQLLSIKLRVADIMPPGAPSLRRLVLAGGASSNAVIQQVVADVFRTSAYIVDRNTGTQEAAAFGGALLARYAWWRNTKGERGTFEDMMAETGETSQMKLGAEPDAEAARVYEDLVGIYGTCERRAIAIYQGSSHDS